MNSTFEHIILRTELSQSDFFGEQYEELLNNSESSAFSSPIAEDVGELLSTILLKYPFLSDFQREMLVAIFNEFNNIRVNIDPSRLRPFQHYLNDDNELLLFRNTDLGLINIIINPDECIAFSFIPKNDSKRQFYFVHPGEDLEELAYDFFSH